MDAFMQIKKQYRKKFEEFNDEVNKINASEVYYNKMEAKAYAWYYVTYHSSELRRNEPMISFPWIIHERLCENVRKKNEN